MAIPSLEPLPLWDWKCTAAFCQGSDLWDALWVLSLMYMAGCPQCTRLAGILFHMIRWITFMVYSYCLNMQAILALNSISWLKHVPLRMCPYLHGSLVTTKWGHKSFCTWARCVVDVASCLHCFTTHFELSTNCCCYVLSCFRFLESCWSHFMV